MAGKPAPIGLDMREDGWAVLVPSPPGWDGVQIALRADLVDGAPRCTGVEVQPLPGTTPRDAVLTVSRLRTLPLDAFAAQVYAAANLQPGTVPDYIQVADDAATAAASMPRGRRATSAEEVARVYARARLEGRAPRDAVCEALAISKRTADRYIGEARRRGLLAPYNGRKAQQ